MNRKERRGMVKELRKEQHQMVAKLPDKLTLIPPDEFPADTGERLPVLAWYSNRYMAQLYNEDMPQFPYLVRLSVTRVKLNKTGAAWQDGLTWDELQSIKREVGYGDWYGMEIYPPDKDTVNVANMRHLWLLPIPLAIGWFGEDG